MTHIAINGQPHTFNHACILGEKALDAKDYATAAVIFETLLENPATPAPERARAHVGLGYMHVESGNAPEALSQAFTARQLVPAYLKTYHLAMLALETLGTPLDKRIFWCDGGLAHHPRDVGLNIARTLIDSFLGNDAAAGAKAVALLPQLPKTEIHTALVLSSVIAFATPAETWAKAFGPVAPFSPLVDIMNDVYRQIGAWLTGDFEALRALNAQDNKLYESLSGTNVSHRNRDEAKSVLDSYTNAGAFLFMNMELGKRPYAADMALPPLYVVGDSHILPPHGQTVVLDGKPHRLEGKFCIGTKLWFIANPKRPYYRHKIQLVLRELPPDAPILITLGEIDTRATEGIWVVAREKGLPLDKIIADTVTGGLDWLAGELAKHPRRPVILSGIPALVQKRDAPRFAEAPQEHLAYARMIRDTNQSMAAEAGRHGWRFLDLHALTAKPDGFSNGRWHMELTHLLPEAHAEAFSHHLK